MTTVTTLKPCPFCGYDAALNSFNEGKHSVECEGCGSRGQYYQTEDAAIKFWNERTLEDCDKEERHRKSFEDGFAAGVYESKRAVMNAQSSICGAKKIEGRWGMTSKAWPTSVLLKEADISYNTAKTILGPRPIAQYNYQAAQKRKERRNARTN